MPNLVPNPCAATDLTSWEGNSDASLARVTTVLGTSIPSPATTALRVDANDLLESDEIAFPEGVGPGDSLAWAVDLSPGATAAGGIWFVFIGWYAEASWTYTTVLETATLDGWTHYEGTVEIPADMTGFDVYVSSDELLSDYLYATNFFVEGVVMLMVDLDGEFGLTISLDGSLTVRPIVEPSGDLGLSVGMEGDLFVEPELSGDLSLRIGMEGELFVGDLQADLDGELSIGVGFAGTLALGVPLPPTEWEWATPDVDPEILQSLRVRLSTRDGEYTVVDPAELADIGVNLTRKGGVDTMNLILRRDSRLELGDLDYGTDCEVEYLGRIWPAWLTEASLSHGSEMSRSVTLLGFIMRLKEEHEAFRRIYVDSRLSAWKTDQGPNTAANVFEVAASE